MDLDTYRVLGELPQSASRVYIDAPLDHGQVTTLIAKGPKEVDGYVRSIWLSHLPTTQDRILGQFRVNTLVQFIHGRIPIQSVRSCRDVFVRGSL